MANIRIPTYERQVEGPQQKASKAKAPEPLRQAYGENVAQATGNLGKAMMQVGDDLIKINAKNNKDKILLETGKFDIEYKKFQADLKNRDDYQNFSADTDNFLDKQLTNMKNNLGDDLFNKWWKVEGQLLADTIKAQTDIMKVPASIKQENKNIKDNIATQAYNYATGDNITKSVIYDSVVNQIENSAQPADVKLGMIRDAQSSFAKGDIEYNMYEKPEEVIKKIEGGAYKETYTDENGKKQTRSFITPEEEGRYLRRCKALIESRKETTKDEKVKPYYDKFEELYSQSPALAKEYYDGLKDRNELKNAGLKTNQINTVLNAMNRAIEGGVLGQQSLALEQENTIDKKLLFSADKEAGKTGEFLPIEQYVDFIDNSNEKLNSGALTTADYDKVFKNRNEAYLRLGDNIKKEEYFPTTETGNRNFYLWSTNNGYLKTELQKVFTDSGMLANGEYNNITSQEVGMIYANAYKYCGNIDMTKTKNSQSEIAIQEAISKSLIEWTMAKYGKSAKEASEFLIGNSVLKLRKDIKDQELGFTLNSYKD